MFQYLWNAVTILYEYVEYVSDRCIEREFGRSWWWAFNKRLKAVRCLPSIASHSRKHLRTARGVEKKRVLGGDRFICCCQSVGCLLLRCIVISTFTATDGRSCSWDVCSEGEIGWCDDVIAAVRRFASWLRLSSEASETRTRCPLRAGMFSLFSYVLPLLDFVFPRAP